MQHDDAILMASLAGKVKKLNELKIMDHRADKNAYWEIFSRYRKILHSFVETSAMH